MVTGEGVTSVSGDQGTIAHYRVPGHLVDGSAVVGVVLDREGGVTMVTGGGWNCWKVESEFVPEESV